MPIDVVKLGHEMQLAIEKDEGVHRRIDSIAEEVVRTAKMLSPVPPGDWPQTPTTGAYRAAWHKERAVGRKLTGGRWLPQYTVVNDDPKAVFIEYGTGPDKPDSKSTWGPNTPTPEFAIARRTAAIWGGHA